MKLIVGLGNPGPEYAKTRHNAGFMAIEKLANRHGLMGAKHKFHAGVLEGRINMHKVMLMQPTTYMNRSGLAVGEAAAFYKLEPEDILILVDEIALDVGQIRLRASGSPGGHNGLKDLERALGTRDYPRLRLGIGPRTRAPQVDFVLGRFTGEQLDEMNFTLGKACDCIESWLEDGIELAMTKFNGG
ncbi:aminoacyl-tRNA hydrolase [Algisphaera agarilytica]|uniref:Peptidyl-tRNA hydrolase n=1 Tax=Algisphaera agarilytica TaxID=1385975 RepID=A0A7X0LLG6_9BACT|nr:aminoacyl-tRNA hydrolase [Algisphaera agarilytica]MBB6430889.1 PTH1 family peptidyl-tRNA hydrolase [Algisphaera agarilytica]